MSHPPHHCKARTELPMHCGCRDSRLDTGRSTRSRNLCAFVFRLFAWCVVRARIPRCVLVPIGVLLFMIIHYSRVSLNNQYVYIHIHEYWTEGLFILMHTGPDGYSSLFMLIMGSLLVGTGTQWFPFTKSTSQITLTRVAPC